VLIGLVAAAFTGHMVARRRRPGDGTGLAADDESRRDSARAIVAACAVLTAAPLAGAAFIAGGALLDISCGGTSFPARWARVDRAGRGGDRGGGGRRRHRRLGQGPDRRPSVGE
jgi:hypothetical protein